MLLCLDVYDVRDVRGYPNMVITGTVFLVGTAHLLFKSYGSQWEEYWRGKGARNACFIRGRTEVLNQGLT